MIEYRFADAAAIGGARKTEVGYLVAVAFAVRAGIPVYTGAEVGVIDREEVRVWRPEDEVRAPESLRALRHAPITLGHPDRVTANNWKDLANGKVPTELTWDGNKIKLPLIIKEAEAIITPTASSESWMQRSAGSGGFRGAPQPYESRNEKRYL